MHGLVSNKMFFKAAILTILLAGLLFSKGEGIRLLPFPAVAQAACDISNLTALIDAGYNENASRFEKRQNPFGLHKHGVEADLDAEDSISIEIDRKWSAIRDFVKLFPDTSISFNRTFPSDLNSRPPPSV